MNEHVKDGQEKRRFPSVAGIFGGVLLAAAVPFYPATGFWFTLNTLVLVLGLVFAAANVVGLAVLKYRDTSNPNAYES